MPDLVICNECEGHHFVVIRGEWDVYGEHKLRSPIVLLCVGCGRAVFTAMWSGDETDTQEEKVASE